MWPKKYKDYPEDTPLVQEQVESGDGIIGCEMHDLNGYQLKSHHYRRRKNIIAKLMNYFFGRKR